jgi:hypothetical protein
MKAHADFLHLNQRSIANGIKNRFEICHFKILTR